MIYWTVDFELTKFPDCEATDRMNLAQPQHLPHLVPQRSPLLLPVLVTAVIAHALILVPLPLLLRAGATLVLAGLLPGLLLVEWLVGGRGDEQGARRWMYGSAPFTASVPGQA